MTVLEPSHEKSIVSQGPHIRSRCPGFKRFSDTALETNPGIGSLNFADMIIRFVAGAHRRVVGSQVGSHIEHAQAFDLLL